MPSEKNSSPISASSDSTARTPSSVASSESSTGAVMIQRYVLFLAPCSASRINRCSLADHKILVNSWLIILSTCGTMPRPGKTSERASSSNVNGSVPALSSSRWVTMAQVICPAFRRDSVRASAAVDPLARVVGRSRAAAFGLPYQLIGLDYAVLIKLGADDIADKTIQFHPSTLSAGSST